MEVQESREDESLSVGKRPARKWLLRAVVIVAVIIAALYVVPMAMHALSHESTDDAFVDGTVVPRGKENGAEAGPRQS